MDFKKIFSIFIKVLGLFVSAFGTAWLFIEAGSYFSIFSIPAESKSSYFRFIVIGSLLLANGIFFGDRYLNYTNSPFSAQKKHIESTLIELNKVAKQINKEEDPFKLNMLSLRLDTELRKFKQIYGGHWAISAHQTYEYLRHSFGHALLSLGADDEYIGISNLDFWAKNKFGESEFLDLNLDAADRGVEIKRVIVVDKNIFNIDYPNREDQESFFNIVKEFYAKYEAEEDRMKKIELYFYLSHNYNKDAGYPVPFAIVHNKKIDKYMAILSNLPKEGEPGIPKIDFHFINGKHSVNYQKYQNRFKNLFKKKKDKYTLEQMYQKVMERWST